IDRPGDPRDDLLDERKRNYFAVAVALRFRDRPAACGDRLRARIQDGFGAPSIPCVIEDYRLSFRVQVGETFSFLSLVHDFLLFGSRQSLSRPDGDAAVG